MQITAIKTLQIVLIIITLQLICSIDTNAQSCSQDQINELRNSGVADDVISNVCPSVSTHSAVGSGAADKLGELAISGNATAAYQLGQMYEKGDGVLKDYVKSYAWYSKAYSDSGNEAHKSALDSLEAKMDPADIEKAQELAKQTDPSNPVEDTGGDIEVDLPAPTCKTEYVTKWVPIQAQEDIEGDEEARSESSGCRKAKRSAMDFVETDECEISIFNFRDKLRSVRQQVINEQCNCEDDTDYGMGYYCHYVATVYCTAEKRVREKVEVCN